MLEVSKVKYHILASLYWLFVARLELERLRTLTEHLVAAFEKSTAGAVKK
jgi:hypothetical protein